MLEVIDVAGLQDKDPAAIGRIAKEIGTACRDIGFFYVRNHGIPQDLMNGVIARFADYRGKLEDAAAKGKGVPVMENVPAWHGSVKMTREQTEEALQALGGSADEIKELLDV